MSLSFKELMSQRGNSTSKLREAIASLDKKSYRNDEDARFWQPKLDESDRAAALIRFLPGPDEVGLNFVKLFNHAFQGPGGWYIENSLTTLGQPDPVQEANSRLWATKMPSDEAEARRRGRNMFFYSNILVIKDPLNPENEGKVFLYRYGKKIFDKIKALQFPEFGEPPINVFDPIDGANFKMKISVNIVNGKKMRNYDACSFDNPSSIIDLVGGEDKFQTLWETSHSLKQFLAPDQFKSYDDLNKRFIKVTEGTMPVKEKEVSVPQGLKDDQKFLEELNFKKDAPIKIDDDEDDVFKSLLDD